MAKDVEELKPAANDGTGEDTQTIKLPSATRIKNALKHINETAADIDELKGSLGAFLKAEKAIGVNLPALGLVRKLQRMEDGRRADFLAQLDHMREIFNLDNVTTLDLPEPDESEEAA